MSLGCEGLELPVDMLELERGHLLLQSSRFEGLGLRGQRSGFGNEGLDSRVQDF